MTKEEEYKITLLHVIKWLKGNGDFDMWKPVQADFANKIMIVCQLVVDGKTLEEACKEIET